MIASSEVSSSSVSSAQATDIGELSPTDRLVVPHRKRMSYAYVTNDGVTELCIYYGLKEISFDEEKFFAFGEQLVKQSCFAAEDAVAWGTGYTWTEVRPLLQALLADGIVKHERAVEEFQGGGLVPSQVRVSECTVPRSWSAAECEGITRDIAGHPVEVGYLEAILSVYRIAHPALDADGRQVGEANVFPPRLRLNQDTEWRVCQYSGSRYRDEAPMNVTALKAMIKYWKPMMATLLEIRTEVMNRLERTRAGWTVGDVHTLACIVLALPAFQLMKGGGTAPQRPLHPVLSSLFRITDGVRMATHEMLFLSAERSRLPEEPLTASELYAYTERSGILLSDTGVCAGPKALIEEFFTVFFDGTEVAGMEEHPIPPEVRDLLAELPSAVDYAFYGMQVWGIARSAWLAMSRAYKSLLKIWESVSDTSLGQRLLARFQADWRKLEWARIADDYERDVHDVVYADAYEQAWRGLRAPKGAATYAERIAARGDSPIFAAAAMQIRRILLARFSSSDCPEFETVVERIVETLVLYLREEQAILGSSTELEETINRLMDRPLPTRPLSVRDLRVNYTMLGVMFPYLFDTLEGELGLRVDSNAVSIAVSDAEAA
jgi:hypothetical protein